MSGLTRAILIAGAFVLEPAMSQPILVGQTLSVSGSGGDSGTELARGRDACFESLNSKGGVGGHLFRLVTLDDQGETGRASANVRTLAERDGVSVLMGSTAPATSIAMLQAADRIGLAVLGPRVGLVGQRTKEPGTGFVVTANRSAEASKLVQHLVSLGARRLAVVHTADPEGMATHIAFEEALTVAGLAAEVVLAIQPSGSDAEEVVKRVRAAKPDAILFGTRGSTTVALLKSLNAGPEAGFSVMAIGGLASSATQAELRSLGRTAQGYTLTQVVPSPTNTRLPVVATYREAMRKAGLEPSYVSLEGCIEALVLGDVLRRKGVELTRSGVLKALRTAGLVDLGGFEVDISDRDRPGSRFTDIVFIGRDGRVVR